MSSTLDEQLDEILNDLVVDVQHDASESGLYSRPNELTTEAKQQLLALIEVKERMAKVGELNWLHTEHVRHFERDSCDIIKERIEALQKGEK